ncbi:MAG: hypothetical protein WA669_20885, partial [Pseudolabrys sp.]
MGDTLLTTSLHCCDSHHITRAADSEAGSQSSDLVEAGAGRNFPAALNGGMYPTRIGVIFELLSLAIS